MTQERSSMRTELEEPAEHLDPMSRRRLQNRLNQRARRKRKQAERQQEQRGQHWVIYTNDANASPMKKDNRAQSTLELTSTPRTSLITQRHNDLFSCGNSRLSPMQYLDHIKRQMIEAAGKLPPSVSLIHSVKQFNIFRAMFNNAAAMELTMDILCEDIASLFNIAGPITLRLPPSLQPSSTQKQIIHHPWIDLLPVRSFRNTLIARMTEYDDEELCCDLYGLNNASGEVGLVIWGESWDPLAYEVSEKIVKKWSWILKGSPELLASTNYWRKKRGEKPLRLIESDEHFIHEID